MSDSIYKREAQLARELMKEVTILLGVAIERQSWELVKMCVNAFENSEINE